MKNLQELDLTQKKYIIFDIDGTLIDSIGVWNVTDKEMIKQTTGKDIDIDQINCDRDWFLKTYTSSDIYLKYCHFLIEKYSINISIEDLLKLRWEISGKMLEEDMDFKPDVVTLLKKLKSLGKTLAIASATTQKQINIYSNLNKKMSSQIKMDEFFDIIVTKEMVTNKKPNPEIYLNLIKHFNAKPEECLVFEDSLVGVTASTKAGLDTVVIYDRYSDGDREEINKLGTYKIDNYKEFIETLNLSN